MQIGGEGTSSESIQAEKSPARERAESVTGPSQEDLVIPFLVGAKTRPMTRFANKQGPSTQTLASTKRPTKTPSMGSNSKRPKR